MQNEEYIDCVLVETVEEFMRVLEVCQAFLPEDSVLWVDPAVIETKTK